MAEEIAVFAAAVHVAVEAGMAHRDQPYWVGASDPFSYHPDSCPLTVGISDPC